jgi:hypothetical protein
MNLDEIFDKLKQDYPQLEAFVEEVTSNSGTSNNNNTPQQSESAQTSKSSPVPSEEDSEDEEISEKYEGDIVDNKVCNSPSFYNR